jgi:hypothetical protein
MQRLRQLFCALILTCLLAPATWADDGVMHPDLTPPPPPPTTPPTQPGGIDPANEGTALIGTVVQLTLDLVNMLGRL